MQKTSTLNKKLQLVIHYIIQKCLDANQDIGKERLSKILWFVDTTYYHYSKTSITFEDNYRRLNIIIVPESFDDVVSHMVEENVLKISTKDYVWEADFYELTEGFGYSFEHLSRQEKALIDHVISYVYNNIETHIDVTSYESALCLTKHNDKIPLSIMDSPYDYEHVSNKITQANDENLEKVYH